MKKFSKVGNETTARNIIGQGTVIKGDIESNGDFRIDGHLVGSIRSTGKIVVGQSGFIEGEVNCQHADVSGKIHAKMNVAELTSLKATAKFQGELFTARLSIEVGVHFNGKCEMIESGKKINEGEKK